MESYLPFCRRMRRPTSYLPCSSRSLSWSLISCALLRTRTTSRRDWLRSSRNSRMLSCPCRIWSRTTTLMPSHSECKHLYPFWTDTETKIYQWLIRFKLETLCMHSCINGMSITENQIFFGNEKNFVQFFKDFITMCNITLRFFSPFICL